MKKQNLKNITIFLILIIIATVSVFYIYDFRKKEKIVQEKQLILENELKNKENQLKEKATPEDLALEETLINVSDREDLIAANKIKPIPEEDRYVIKDGKKIPISPPEYKSKDECGKAMELFEWRNAKFDLNVDKKSDLYFAYQFIHKEYDDLYFYIILKDLDGTLRVVGCFIDSTCSASPRKFQYVKLKGVQSQIINYPRIAFADDYKHLPQFKERFLFIEEQNCQVKFYKGNNFN